MSAPLPSACLQIRFLNSFLLFLPHCEPLTMAEETKTTTPLVAEELAEKDAPPEPEPEQAVGGKEKEKDEVNKITESTSFKEESNKVDDLIDPEKKALDEFKQLIKEALEKHEFTAPSPAKDEEKKSEEPEVEKKIPEEPPPPLADEKTIPPPPAVEEKAEAVDEIKVHEVTASAPEEVSIWGIPLLADDRSDVVLLKFLRARDFKVKDAFVMLKNVVAWRKSFKIDELLKEEGVGEGLEKVVYSHGVDKEGHPVCYNAFGEFHDKELYSNTFADAEKRAKFLRFYIQFLEKNIRKLDFSPDGICTIVQITDLKNSPGLILFKKELRQATNQALQLLQDNYPEFVAKQVFINVPWWYVAYNRMISPFLTQRTKSKFVFAETLCKYIAPEQVPVEYGGLSKDDEQEFSGGDAATEVIIKPASKHIVELPISEACILVWEVRVVGWDVSYSAEFVPSGEDRYTWIVHKMRKVGASDEQVISCNNFKIGETGKVVLTFDNQTSKKKKLFYRSKTKQADL